MAPIGPPLLPGRRHLLTGLGATAALQLTGGLGRPARAEQRATRQARLRAPLSKPNGLNLVVIIADSTRCDYLRAFGNMHVRTPNLARLAGEGVAFENTYADGLPTIPCRRVYHAGRSLLREKRAWWRPLDEEDVTLAEVARKAGLHTGLIVDTYHYFAPGMNFHRGYDSWQWIRGQELIPGSALPGMPSIPPATCRPTS